MPDETHHRVVVPGGGLVGVFSARHLQRRARSGVEMLRISRRDLFVSQ
jgi:NADH dehydrogenase FAD-containing subunit